MIKNYYDKKISLEKNIHSEELGKKLTNFSRTKLDRNGLLDKAIHKYCLTNIVTKYYLS